MGHVKRQKRRKAAKTAAPRIVEKFHFVGFGQTCRERLAPVRRYGCDVPPNPVCVRRVLKDERPSRAMLFNIFKNAPELLGHPLTSEDVKLFFRQWKAYGTIPDGYGRGVPPKRAADCKKEVVFGS